MTQTITSARKVPAALGGEPAFPRVVPIIRPNLPPWESVRGRLEEIYGSRLLTNGRTVAEFERAAASYLGVPHAVALSSCTLGLVLVLRALEVRGEIILPSFTFSATGHAVYWAGARPVFVDCSSRDWNVSIGSIEKAISRDTAAIVAVHIFGNPAPVAALEEIAHDLGVPLVFDAAHAFGASVGARRVGCFGAAEVFSLSPTKLLTACEGGLVATNDRALAEELRVLRNYGDPGTYDCLAPGLNARMEEWNAALALEGLPFVDAEITRREHLARCYREELSRLPGLSFQEIAPESQHTYKDFTILVDPEGFRMDRDRLHACLLAENVQAKKYFYPPLHLQRAYRALPHRCVDLSETERVSENVLTLPLYSSLGEDGVRRIAETVAAIHEHAEELDGAAPAPERSRS